MKQRLTRRLCQRILHAPLLARVDIWKFRQECLEKRFLRRLPIFEILEIADRMQKAGIHFLLDVLGDLLHSSSFKKAYRIVSLLICSLAKDECNGVLLFASSVAIFFTKRVRDDVQISQFPFCIRVSI